MKTMNSIFKSIFIVLVSLYLCSSLIAQNERGVTSLSINKLPSADKRWALIVGVNNFGLKGPENDAAALKDVLVKYAGFPEDHVILLTTDNPSKLPTRKNILLELNNLSRQIEPDGLFLFAFSGHGKTIGDNGYIIPSDGEWSDNNTLLEEFSININKIKKAIEEIKVKQVLMFIDACRDHIETGQKGSLSEPLTEPIIRGFNFYEANKSVEAFVTLYAARDGESAYEYFDTETGQTRGYFSKVIEEAISGKAANEKGEVTLEALIKYLQKNVPDRSYRLEGKRQTPFVSSNEAFNEAELILSVVPPENKNNLTPAQIAWSKFRGLAKSLLKYDDIYRFSEGLAWTIQNGKWGFIDTTGREIVLPKYDKINSFSEGLAVVELNDKYRLIDKTGKEILTLKYDYVESFKEGLAPVRLNHKEGFIDKTGKEVIPLNYDVVYPFSEGLAVVVLNNKYGLIDKTGKEVIPFKYDLVRGFSEGLAYAQLGDKYGFIDKSGSEVIPFEYYFADSFSEGLARVYSNGKYGFIDTTGREVIPFKYSFVFPFSEGLASVELSGKYGVIDKSGREVISPGYDFLYSFSEGIADVHLNNKIGFIDKSGRKIVPVKYDNIWCYAFEKEGFIGVTLNDKKGFVDIYGNEYFDF